MTSVRHLLLSTLNILIFFSIFYFIFKINYVFRVEELLPDSITTPEINIPFKGNNHFTFMNLFAKLAKFNNASIIDIDGVKIIYPDSWGLIRCSNTTSNLVLRFEADDIDAMTKIQSLIRNEMLKIDDKLELPF